MDDRYNEIALIGKKNILYDMRDKVANFADTAAVIDKLDLVITVDTAVAHLAGAIGKPVWTLLSFAADWRWLIDREDSPWYPTMKLFRQKTPGDWKGVIANVRDALFVEFDNIG
jgi:ADP-heptose:LPS heptosyltransferase